MYKANSLSGNTEDSITITNSLISFIREIQDDLES